MQKPELKDGADAKTIVDALTRETDQVVFTLRDAKISGELNLKHCIVKVAVDIRNCKVFGGGRFGVL